MRYLINPNNSVENFAAACDPCLNDARSVIGFIDEIRTHSTLALNFNLFSLVIKLLSPDGGRMEKKKPANGDRTVA